MTAETTALFRCVCGAVLTVDDDGSTSCRDCGRRYSKAAVNVSATMSLDGGFSTTDDDEPQDELVGKSIDHFTILQRLGAGGWGRFIEP